MFYVEKQLEVRNVTNSNGSGNDELNLMLLSHKNERTSFNSSRFEDIWLIL